MLHCNSPTSLRWILAIMKHAVLSESRLKNCPEIFITYFKHIFLASGCISKYSRVQLYGILNPLFILKILVFTFLYLMPITNLSFHVSRLIFLAKCLDILLRELLSGELNCEVNCPTPCTYVIYI